MKRILAILLAMMLLAAVPACAEEAGERFEFKDFSFATPAGWKVVSNVDSYILVANKGTSMPLATMVVTSLGVDESQWGDVSSEQMMLMLYDESIKNSYDEYVVSHEMLFNKPVMWYSFKKSNGYQTWIVLMHNEFIIAFGYSTGNTSRPDDTADVVPYIETLQYKGQNVFEP